jgi:hypothetical protein
MTFKNQIKKLAAKAIACTSEEEAVEKVQRMQVLMHTRVEEVRNNLITLSALGIIVPSDAELKTGSGS